MNNNKKSNYLKLFIIIIGAIMVTIIICNMYRNSSNKVDKSYLSKYVPTIEYNELSTAVTELNTNSFIYLSYEGEKEVNNLEKKLRKIIKLYDYEDNFIYVDCTKYLEENHSVKGLNNLYLVGNGDIILPAIIYFKNNEPTDYIDSKNGLFNVGDFSQLLDKYELESSRE